MSNPYGYIVDLFQYKLDESTKSTWMMAAPLGKYTHPLYGEINMTPQKHKNFAENFNNNVRGQDIEVDYDHKSKVEYAAGWVKAVEARSDGLWQLVEWTPEGFSRIKNREYRYFSPEYKDEWTHPSTGKTFTDVLFGGGLTNRPYLKGIMPINLSEFTSESNPEGSKSMTPEQRTQLITKYKLDANATDDDILKAANDAELKDVDPAEEPDPTKTAAQLSEMQKEIDRLKKLSETDDNMKPLVALMESQAEQLKQFGDKIAKQEAALRLTEIASTVNKFDDKVREKGYALPKPVIEGMTNFLNEHSTTKKFSDDISNVIDLILDAQLVELGERRNGGPRSDNSGSATKKFDEAVRKFSEEHKVGYGDAAEEVAKAEPKLFNEYLEEFRGGEQ